ncbi:MAG: MFS transporter [Rhizobiaceae bacterium]|nr:MFS transporter [Rhizobiaceae bacterium]
MTVNAQLLSDEEENAIARKNVLLYLMCQALGAASAPINIALGGLVGHNLLGEDKSLATLPITAYNIGVAIGAIIANAIMRQIGRKLGFMTGCAIGLAGTIFTGLAITAESFWLFCSALCVNGMSSGFVQQYRFAAADRGTADYKPKAISTILLGGVAAAIIGPQLVIYATDLAAPVPFAGAFYAASILFVLSFFALTFLNPSNLQMKPQEVETTKSSRSLAEIASQPKFAIAVLCGTATYALMAFVMTAAPLAMVGHGHSHDHSTLGIQWHVMAMFAPSIFTGSLISRFGKETIVATGLLILVVCGFVALAGYDLMHFWGSLILLGIGWNFGFIGATAMVTETYEPHEKNKAQGLNDFILFGSVAVASFMSGLTLNAYGWELVNWIIFPVVAMCFVGLGWLRYADRSQHT